MNSIVPLLKPAPILHLPLKVAEAAKVIENAQRDINVAFINELALIFAHMEDIKTADVLHAAKTKWNFLDFSPGWLVDPALV